MSRRRRSTGGAGRPPLDEVHVLLPSVRKWALTLVVSVPIGGFMGAAIIVEHAVNAMTVAGALVFGLAVVASIAHLVPGLAYLRIAPEGLIICNPFAGTTRYGWDEVEKFEAYEVPSRYGTSKLVGFDLRTRTHQQQKWWQTLNRGLSDVDVSLPDTYGMDAQELARLLNAYARRHRHRSGQSPSHRDEVELRRRAAAVDARQGMRVTLSTCVLCVAVFAYAVHRFGWTPDAADLRRVGGVSLRGLEDGAFLSLLTSALLHAHVLHLVLSLAAFAVVGSLLEREIGPGRMVGLMTLGALTSSLLAVALHPRDVTVGLSGVGFAVMAAAVRRDPHRTRALGSVAWPLLFLNAVYTFLLPGISIGGHIGGLVAGLAVGRAPKSSEIASTNAPVADD